MITHAARVAERSLEGMGKRYADAARGVQSGPCRASGSPAAPTRCAARRP